MQQERLAELITSPRVQQMLLGSYSGGYSIGITADPIHQGKPAIRVRTEGCGTAVPESIVLDGETITVLSHTNFVRPKPLSRS